MSQLRAYKFNAHFTSTPSMPASLLSTFPYPHGSPLQTSPMGFIFSEFRSVPLRGSGLTTCLYHSASRVKLILVASKVATVYTDGKAYQEIKVMWNITDEYNVFSKECVWEEGVSNPCSSCLQKCSDSERKITLADS